MIDLTTGRTDSWPCRPKTVALTFDDGPDPQWTPQVLAVLAKYHVPATFFVVGSRAAHYPELVRAIRASGSEIGLHTFTHPDLREVSPTRVDQEFAATQLALAGATGQMSYLVRPPYSSEAVARSTTPVSRCCSGSGRRATSPRWSTSTATTGSVPGSTPSPTSVLPAAHGGRRAAARRRR